MKFLCSSQGDVSFWGSKKHDSIGRYSQGSKHQPVISSPSLPLLLVCLSLFHTLNFTLLTDLIYCYSFNFYFSVNNSWFSSPEVLPLSLPLPLPPSLPFLSLFSFSPSLSHNLLSISLVTKSRGSGVTVPELKSLLCTNHLVYQASYLISLWLNVVICKMGTWYLP